MSLYFFQNVQPKQGTPGVAQESAPAGAPAQQNPPGSMLTMLLPFLILVPFLFMSFRRQKKEAEARKSLKKGDRVVTQAGLIGELVDMDARIAKVKIAPGTTVQVLANAVSSFEPQAATASKTDKELADLKEAKATADKK
ncbi:MAG: preprotein translocase subunit YajC [Myxococcales bacterium 68-20]|nr:preprotein translocase subunit YajC [Myxococcales bacterium]OJY29149.1 MAG: preprotein translocase subunit YajC [Myxococcales bacterium 68-20]